MRIKNEAQARRKTQKSLEGGTSYWNRITNDPDFIKAKRKIQARYSLPLPFDIYIENKAWRDWLGIYEHRSLRAKNGNAFLMDVHALLHRFDIPQKWHDMFIRYIAGTQRVFETVVSNFPTCKIYLDGKWECIVTPETDLNNPEVIYYIQMLQKTFAGDPPKPSKDKDNPRKLDWRPVNEWRKAHPLFTLDEIAKKIGYRTDTVKKKIAELEREK